tara:strand:+ start:225 stop:512 length:288 start_codon:yes stop_codon:yes gene_type:complete
MSTELRNVPNCEAQNELTQTRFWGGADRLTCLQVTQSRDRKTDLTTADKFFTHLSLTKEQARNLAVELMLFAEGREVEALEFVEEDEFDSSPTGV